MPSVKPFRAVRPNPEQVQSIASLPYDVISEKEAREEYTKNPLSFFRIGRPEINFPEGVDPYSEEVYAKGKEVIEEYMQKKAFTQDEKECFYIYAQEVAGYRQVGLVSLVSVDDYDNDVIKKHELTREVKEKDRFNHILKTSAHAEPVFLAYKDNEQINSIIESVMSTTEPVYDFTAEDGVKNTLWVMNDSGLQMALSTNFESSVDCLYIADGHHRAKASSLVGNHYKDKNEDHTGNENYHNFMAVLFPSSQLRILPYNRVIKTDVSIKDLIAKVSDLFKVKETQMGDVPEKGSFIIYADKKAYLFTYKGPQITETEKKLDVALLQNYVLDPILGIKNPRKDKNIDFVGGIRGTEYLKQLVDSGEFNMAVVMYPTSIDELFDVSDEGKIMPPKSTWFEPKLKSGLFLHLIED